MIEMYLTFDEYPDSVKLDENWPANSFLIPKQLTFVDALTYSDLRSIELPSPPKPCPGFVAYSLS
jgi:hypothetical protein